MKSPHDATPEELIKAGWGDYSRERVPHDWETRHGPDTEMAERKKREQGKPAKKWPTVAETDRIAFRAERRKSYLEQTGKLEQLEVEFRKTLVKQAPYGASRWFAAKG